VPPSVRLPATEIWPLPMPIQVLVSICLESQFFESWSCCLQSWSS